MSDFDVTLDAHNLAFVESLFEDYQRNPAALPEDWRKYFAKVANGSRVPFRVGPSFQPASLFHTSANGFQKTVERETATRQDRVDQLVRNYRVRGHRLAKLDPLGMRSPELAELDPKFYGFTEADLDREYSTVNIGGGDTATLREIVRRMRNTYCRFIGAQFMHIDDLHVREWLQERMERTENRLTLRRSEQLRILTRLTDAVVFEEFILKAFQGAKSFSLEGAETLIPLLDLAIEKAGAQGTREVVIGMAHRGRLNVLANIMGKSPRQIFREFADLDPHLHRGGGDVKYHLGYSTDWQTSEGGKVHLSLCFNPSHLECVNPVALGRIRCKQDRCGDAERTRGLCIQIHGDAAFAGEGISQETLNLSELPAYTTGGSLHIIVNNQIGFTTPMSEARSSTYASDVAKMLQIPIFHVNGESPEAVAQVVQMALDFRAAFKRDVVIDMYCYRLRGHNETDEPSYTQPLMYKAIASRDSIRDSYLDQLLTLGGVTVDEADWIRQQTTEKLELELSEAKASDYKSRPVHAGTGLWEPYAGGADEAVPDVETGVPAEKLQKLLLQQTQLPEDFHLHPKLARFMKNRADIAAGKAAVDWSAGETLAFASLAVEGTRVRMTGQDCGRGTFSHRHAVLHDAEDGRTYLPLQHLSPQQGPVEIYNSLLSEMAVMGFEYGYSLDCPDGLVMWEAQFGDFCNTAQVIIDQFIVSAEDKWKRLSGLTLLLPHGFEGQGPEHSSARLERFLNLAAEDNIQVVVPTTPAQIFHVLRRQVQRKIRKPLIIMTPKSLLRHPEVVSSWDELATGTFRRIIPDVTAKPRKKLKKIILCTGKFYYDLNARRTEAKRDDVAILRLEQLYPLRHTELQAALEPYPSGTPLVWAQEEPENMGAWRFLKIQWGDSLFDHPFSGVYRAASASPATGSGNAHKIEQKELLDAAFA